MSAAAQATEPKGNLTVVKPTTSVPRYVYDFNRLKRKERTEFAEDIQRSINFKESGLTPDQADALALKWITRLIVAWPDGFDLTKPEVFEDLSAVEWKEATAAFMDQFRTAFGIEESGS